MTALKDDCLRQRDEIIALPLGTALCAAYAAAVCRCEAGHIIF